MPGGARSEEKMSWKRPPTSVPHPRGARSAPPAALGLLLACGPLEALAVEWWGSAPSSPVPFRLVFVISTPR